MRWRLSLFRRGQDRALRDERTWREFYECCKANLFTLISETLGSKRAAEEALTKVFVLYAKDCVARRQMPSVAGVLRIAVEWLRAEPLAQKVDEPDSTFPIRILPLESRLAFLFWYRLELEPEEIGEALQEPVPRVFSKALAASLRLCTVQAEQSRRSPSWLKSASLSA